MFNMINDDNHLYDKYYIFMYIIIYRIICLEKSIEFNFKFNSDFLHYVHPTFFILTDRDCPVAKLPCGLAMFKNMYDEETNGANELPLASETSWPSIKYALPIPRWKAEQKQNKPETRKDHRLHLFPYPLPVRARWLGRREAEGGGR